MQVDFVAKVVDDTDVIGGYVLTLDLPFTPMLGMKLKGGTSTWLWETVDKNELDPEVKEIVYNLDDEKLYCLFEINNNLASARWTKISNLQSSYELSQFETH